MNFNHAKNRQKMPTEYLKMFFSFLDTFKKYFALFEKKKIN